jgi:hypothetical protein
MGIPALTPLERHEAALRLFCIIEKVKGIKSGKPGDARERLLRQEKALAAELMAQWRKAYTDALKDIFDSIPEDITEDAMKLIEDGILSALGPAFGNSATVRAMMKKTIGAVYADSKREWALKTPEGRRSPLLSLPDRRAIEVLTRHNCFWLGEHYGEHIGPKVSELARQALDSGLGRKAFAKELKRTLGGVAPADYKYWDVAASAALVRARSFGVISGMEDAEITEYEVVAMGDERMCDICGEMSGRVFSVAEAKSLMDRAIGIKDPTEFKKTMPWQTRPMVGVSGKKIMSDGQTVPPFHGRCRCIIISHDGEASVTQESFGNLAPKWHLSKYDADTRIAVIGANSIPKIGLPGWKYDIVGKNGIVKQRRFFDDKGKPAKDVDMTHHGSPKAHPVPHIHEWNNGGRNESFRKPKAWEKKMAEDLGVQVTKNGLAEKETAEGISPYSFCHFASVEDFMKDIACGAEVEFEYDGHKYTVAGYSPPQAWEAYKDETWRKFEDIPDMFSNFKVHTGEALSDIATKLEVTCDFGGFVELVRSQTNLTWRGGGVNNP